MFKQMCFEIISCYNSLLWIRLDVIERLDRSMLLNKMNLFLRICLDYEIR